jgi:hypothetical protein
LPYGNEWILFLSGIALGMNLPAPKAGMVATGDVLEVVVEDAGLAVEESNFYEGEAPHHGGIPLFHHPPRTPLGVLVVNDPITHF